MSPSGSGGCSRCYAPPVRQRFAKAASAVLRNNGSQKFLPLYHARRRWANCIAEIDLPLFPGYVFCQFDAPDCRIPIVGAPRL
jgi:hypothetical protein